jgi:outer membrane lipoprotein carrier protein
MNRLTLKILPALLAVALPACGGPHEAADAAGAKPAAVREDAAAPAPAENTGAGDVAPAAPAMDAAPGTAPAPSSPGDAAAPGAPAQPAAAPSSPAPAGAKGSGTSQDRAVEILRQAEAAANGVRTLEADFVQNLTVPLLNQTQRSAGKMYQKRPDRFLMRFSDPAGDVMVADGRHFWLYYPSTDRTQVIRTSIANGAGQVDLQRQFLSNPAQRYVSTLAGEESVGGRPAYVLSLVPRGDSPYRLLRVWVDKSDHLVRRFEMTEENESVRRVELSNLRINGPVADNLFIFTPPAGTQVFDQ